MNLLPFLAGLYLLLAGSAGSPPEPPRDNISEKPNPIVNNACSILGTSRVFHDLAVDSDSYELQMENEGYIIGIEKGFLEKVGRPKYGDDCTKQDGTAHCFYSNDPFYDHVEDGCSPREEIEKHICQGCIRAEKNQKVPSIPELSEENPGKQVFVSHIAKSSKSSGEWKTTLLHNIYCDGSPEQPAHCDVAIKSEECDPLQFPDNQDYFQQGWNELEKLKRQFHRDLDRLHPTDVIVFSFGWNVAQKLAIERMNRLFGIIHAEALLNPLTDFRPIFIGITWPSLWKVRYIDIFNKGNDADEIGASIGNIIINRIVLPTVDDYEAKSSKIRVSVIGHSLGARLLSQSIANKPLLADPLDRKPRKVDLFLGLQAAFSINRYLAGKGLEGSLYKKFKDLSPRIILTNSKEDPIIAIPDLIFPYAGSVSTFKKSCKENYEYHHLFNHWVIERDELKTADCVSGEKETIKLTNTKDHGNESSKFCSEGTFTMVDATEIIQSDESFKTFWDHGSIYSRRMGKFIWQSINLCSH